MKDMQEIAPPCDYGDWVWPETIERISRSKFRNATEALAFAYLCEWSDWDENRVRALLDLSHGWEDFGMSGAEILFGLQSLAADGVVDVQLQSAGEGEFQVWASCDFSRKSARGVFGAAECVLAMVAMRELRMSYEAEK